MSSLSLCDSADGALVDPRVQRLKRSHSHRVEPPSPAPVSAPIPPPKDGYTLRAHLKRAPSYGAVKQEAKLERQRKKDAAVSPSASVTTDVKQLRHERKLSTGSNISSDEEEISRSKRVKKLKTTSLRGSSSPAPSSPTSNSSSSNAMGNWTDTASSSPFGTPSEKKLPSVLEMRAKTPKSTIPDVIGSRRVTRSNLNLNKGKEADMKNVANVSKTTKTSSLPTSMKSKASPNRPSGRSLPMNLQRNPSMFGEELPQLPVVVETVPTTSGIGERIGQTGETSLKKDRIRSPSPVSPLASKSSVKSPTLSSGSPGTRTLRRVKRLDLGLGFGLGARKIEFGGPGGEADHETKKPGKGNVLQGLESAIQLV